MKLGLRALRLILSTSFHVSPRLALLCLAETAGKVLSAFIPLFIGVLASGTLKRETDTMLIAAVALVGSTAVNNLLQAVGTSARVDLMERIGFAFDERVARFTATIPTLDHFESAEYQDQMQLLRDEEGALGQAFNMTVNTVNSLAYAASILAVAATADWRLLILAMFGIPRLLGTRWSVGWSRRAERHTAAPGRLTRHLVDLTTSTAAAAETRVFGYQGELVTRAREAASSWREPRVRLAARNASLSAAFSLLFFGTAAAILAWMTRDAMVGVVDLSALVVGVTVVAGLERVSTTVSYAVQGIARVLRNGSRYLWLEDYAADVHRRHDGDQAPPSHLRLGIRLEDVTFSYRDAEHESITGLTIDLPTGSVVALVGENGAGKSTLVKLLTGLYQPTHGRVLVDGCDLRTMSITRWRSRISAAFQDNASFELTAREVVGIGDIERIEDRRRIDEAVQAAGADAVMTALPHGLDTQLGTTWPDGVDLSGGQLQRLALARSMMREDPLLLVLDEPTSALDAAAEHSLFQRYANAARRVGRQGSITILVTHRFSTVTTADIIIVLDHGQIIEHGRHDELMATQGHYAALYELQAKGYR